MKIKRKADGKEFEIDKDGFVEGVDYTYVVTIRHKIIDILCDRDEDVTVGFDIIEDEQ